MAGARLLLAVWVVLPVFGGRFFGLFWVFLGGISRLFHFSFAGHFLGCSRSSPRSPPDPWGVLQDFWGPSREPPRCELSPTAPLLPPPAGSPQCHPGLGARWWLLALGTAEREGTALLRQGPGEPPGLNVSVFISTLTPSLRGLLGAPQTLHCSFGPAGGPFALRWLRHGRAGTRRLLAFDSAAPRATAAAPGTLLLLGGHGDTAGAPPPGGAMEVSLQLPPLSVSDDGSFVCSVTTPHGQVQQVLRMNVIAPPRGSPVPPRLSPGPQLTVPK
ncbi:tapasin [Passer montanus]|uniref:tapasin n=1 Tax=Passer montanus TaxID=9160 RepID=UPI00196058CE|nr:tapasin [Passer montanus]